MTKEDKLDHTLEAIENFDNPPPYPDEGRCLILRTVLQAKKDLINFIDAQTPKQKEDWQTAYDFLFNDEYYVDWYDDPLRLEDLLDILDINIDWMRRIARRDLEEKLRRRHAKKGTGEESGI